MTHLEASLSTLEEWKKKALDFSDLSTEEEEYIVSTISRGVEAMHTVLKAPEQPFIQRALTSFRMESALCLEFENIDEMSIRSVMYGLFESAHLTLQYLNEQKLTGSDVSLAKIEEWRRKTLEFSFKSMDALLPMISRGFETMSTIHKTSDIYHISGALTTLDNERYNFLCVEEPEESSIRFLLSGFVECLHLTLHYLVDQIHARSSEEIQINCDTISASDFAGDLEQDLNETNITPTIARMKPVQTLECHICNEKNLAVSGFVKHLAEVHDTTLARAKIAFGCVCGFVGTHHKEVYEHMNECQSNAIYIFDRSPEAGKRERSLVKDFERVAVTKGTIPKGDQCSSSAIIIESPPEAGKRTRSSIRKRVVGEKEKASTNDQINEDQNKTNDTPTTSKMEPTRSLDCRICQRKGMSIGIFVKHLTDEHETTPARAGIAFGCGCGFVGTYYSRTLEHTRTCHSSVLSIIDRPSDAGTRARSITKRPSFAKDAISSDDLIIADNNKTNDTPTTSKMERGRTLDCRICQSKDMSIDTFVKHLTDVHNTTPAGTGIIFRCECGFVGPNYSLTDEHIRTCKPRVVSIIDRPPESAKRAMSLRRGVERFFAKKEVISRDDQMGEGRQKTNDIDKIGPVRTLDCRICNEKGMTLSSFIKHLTDIHETTPARSGIAFRCDCGYVGTNHSLAHDHLRTCDSSAISIIDRPPDAGKRARSLTTELKMHFVNKDVISKDDQMGEGRQKTNDIDKMGPVRTLDCRICPEKGMTLSSFIKHLTDKHETTPVKAGISFRCDCGYVGTNNQNTGDHLKTCQSSVLSVIDRPPDAGKRARSLTSNFERLLVKKEVISKDDQMSEDRNKTNDIGKMEPVSTLDCRLCEKKNMTMGTFIKHLTNIHDTTPAKSGIAFRCACGDVATYYAVAQDHQKTCQSCAFSVIDRPPDKRARSLIESPYIVKFGTSNSDQINGDSSKTIDTLKMEPARTLECRICHKKDMAVSTFIKHLTDVHDTTPVKAGLAFRCDCGYVGTNNQNTGDHLKTCQSRGLSIIDRPSDAGNRTRSLTASFKIHFAKKEAISKNDQQSTKRLSGPLADPISSTMLAKLGGNSSKSRSSDKFTPNQSIRSMDESSALPQFSGRMTMNSLSSDSSLQLIQCSTSKEVAAPVAGGGIFPKKVKPDGGHASSSALSTPPFYSKPMASRTVDTGKTLGCLRCPEKGMNIAMFVIHLREVHKTSMYLDKLTLMCVCGYRGGNTKYIRDHKLKCAHSNYSVVKDDL